MVKRLEMGQIVVGVFVPNSGFGYKKVGGYEMKGVRNFGDRPAMGDGFSLCWFCRDGLNQDKEEEATGFLLSRPLLR